MNDILLRPADPADARRLGLLATQVFLDTYATHGIRSAMASHVLDTCSTAAYDALLADPEVSIIVAERDAHLVGFAQVRRHVPPPLPLPWPATMRENAAELRRLYVQERFTGRRLGTSLLDAVERLAAERGASALWLTAWVSNARALAFYPRRGYADIGTKMYEFEDEAHVNRVFAKVLA